MTAHMTTWYSAGKILEHLNAHNKETHKETTTKKHTKKQGSSDTIGLAVRPRIIIFSGKNRMTDQHLIFDKLKNAMD